VFSDIARDPYNEYANRDDDRPRGDLKQIVTRYFDVDVAVLVNEKNNQKQ